MRLLNCESITSKKSYILCSTYYIYYINYIILETPMYWCVYIHPPHPIQPSRRKKKKQNLISLIPKVIDSLETVMNNLLPCLLRKTCKSNKPKSIKYVKMFYTTYTYIIIKCATWIPQVLFLLSGIILPFPYKFKLFKCSFYTEEGHVPSPPISPTFGSGHSWWRKRLAYSYIWVTSFFSSLIQDHGTHNHAPVLPQAAAPLSPLATVWNTSTSIFVPFLIEGLCLLVNMQ